MKLPLPGEPPNDLTTTVPDSSTYVIFISVVLSWHGLGRGTDLLFLFFARIRARFVGSSQLLSSTLPSDLDGHEGLAVNQFNFMNE